MILNCFFQFILDLDVFNKIRQNGSFKIGNAVCSGLFFLRLYDFRTIDDLQRISGRFRIIGNTDTDCDFLFNVSHHLKRLFRSLAYFPVYSINIVISVRIINSKIIDIIIKMGYYDILALQIP